MSAPDSVTTMIITEHMGFAPLTVVDDIINSVNEIMYKCTTALEKYLLSKESKVKLKKADQKQGKEEASKEELNEIEVGTAKLETLLESSVDKNFDLFELYTLRNIFNIPKELVDGGWIRLDHYKHVKHINNLSKKLHDTEERIRVAEREIKFQLFLKQKILGVLRKAKKLSRLLSIYQSNMKFLLQNPTGIRNAAISRDAINALRSLSPVDESLFFLKTEAKEIYKIVKLLDLKFCDTIKDAKLCPDDRDAYVDTKVHKLLQLYEATDSNRDEQYVTIKLSRTKRTSKHVSDLRSVNDHLVITD